MIGLLAVIAIAGGLITKFADTAVQTTAYGDDWRQELQEENERLAQEMEQNELARGLNDYEIQENNFHLENNIKPLPYDGWQYVLENAALSSVLSLFTIVVAAGIIANEFKWGTIKLLLIRPVSRTKILLSKYVSVLLFAFLLLILLLLFSWIVGALLFGLNGLNPTLVQQEPGGFTDVRVVPEIFREYGSDMVMLVMMATFAFMISAIFRSGGMAIGLAIFLMMAGNLIVAAVAQYDWAKYILFANTDLSQYTAGSQPMIEGMSPGFSITVLAVYYLLFLTAAWIAFTKRDVAGQ